MRFNIFYTFYTRHRLAKTLLILLPFLSWSADADSNPRPLNHYDYKLWNSLPSHEIDFPNGDSLTVTKVKSQQTKAAKNRLYIWVGNTYPPNDGTALLAQHLSHTGTVWYLDTPDALFLPRSKTALRNLKGDYLVPLLNTATQKYKQVVVMALEVGSISALRGIRQWQVATNNSKQRNRLKNVVLIYPNLYVDTPVAGHARKLFPIAYETALPISIIQSDRGALANMKPTVFALRSGGSLVRQHILKNTTDGEFHFHNMRKMAKLTADAIMQDVAKQQGHAQRIGYHIAHLEPSDRLKHPPVSKVIRGMKRFDPPIPMPSNIVLHDLEGNKINVKKDYAGKALLINFWATWCPHCVEEIPSMNRALRQLDSNHFEMVSIDYREPKSVVKPFTKKVAVDFPILMDEQGDISKKWKVYSFPSSFLVDKNGMIRYSINAGNIWDTKEMLSYLKQVQSIK